jgi:hypothetical protein
MGSHRAVPLLQFERPVQVDGHAICAECGCSVAPVNAYAWRHFRTDRAPRSSWFTPITPVRIREVRTYQEFCQVFPWAVESFVGSPVITSRDDWQDARQRLWRYQEHVSAIHAQDAPDVHDYLDTVRALAGSAQPAASDDDRLVWDLPPGVAQVIHPPARRRELSAALAWAIPTPAALTVMAAHAPILECGAGTGFWAALMQRMGVDVVACDVTPPGGHTTNRFHSGVRHPWTDVSMELSAVAARRHGDRTLFLCWPPYGDDAASYLTVRAYRGDTLLYAGDGDGHVTGSLRFHRELEANWQLTDQIPLPSWPGIDDRLSVYRRNPVRRPLAVRDRCPGCGRWVTTGRLSRCDRCAAVRPAAIRLRVAEDYLEYSHDDLARMPAVLVRALERSPSRV